MRRTVFALGWLLCPASLLAAPVPAGQSAATVSPAQLQSAAREYAANLRQVVLTVEGRYVRRVSRAELIEAALTGLYEAAQVPVPASLRPDIKSAERGEFDALLVKARLGAGNAEAIQGRKALIVSCRAMLRSLDPFSAVVTGEEAAVTTGFDQNYGLGIDLVDKAGAGPLVIKAVIPGGPAQRAGLQAGDHITYINDRETKSFSTERALRLLNGAGEDTMGDVRNLPPPPDEVAAAPVQVRLTVRSAGDKGERKVALLREQFQPETVQGVTRAADNSWDYWVDRKRRIAQVRIVYLARDGLTAVELGNVLERLDSGEGLGGLILDLRWCPGGYLASATSVVELFLEDGLIATTDVRAEGKHAYKAGGSELPVFPRVPVIVLVNGETTGGGELIAAALQDHKRAAVAGQRTRGKGSIQSPTYVPLSGEGGRPDGQLQLKLTNGTFLRPSGKSLVRFADSKPSDDWGVRPDAGLELRASADLSRQLKEWWHAQSMRPGTSNKSLPLDDPEQDPQRQAALKALLRIMAEKK
jgi:carboxyl-terminal processing protease